LSEKLFPPPFWACRTLTHASSRRFRVQHRGKGQRRSAGGRASSLKGVFHGVGDRFERKRAGKAAGGRQEGSKTGGRACLRGTQGEQNNEGKNKRTKRLGNTLVIQRTGEIDS